MIEEKIVENEILRQLIAMSNNLGKPELDYAIMGEGNTSARVDAGSFYVKVSGSELRTATEKSFVRCSIERVLALMNVPDLDDKKTKEGLVSAKADPTDPGHPSIEALLHALCLRLPGVDFVGHTHPVAINAITCSIDYENAFAGRLFPDEIVVCGPAPVLVPYTDPGIPLALAVGARLDAYLDRYGETPRVVIIQNHGLIALGRTPQQVEDITRMEVKVARILLGTYSAGGPRFMTQADVDRIHTRPDEAYRKQKLGI
jgi:rhamnose utilization protein RhaD (predicted bifunctional aldolase and dehydrogenase)